MYRTILPAALLLITACGTPGEDPQAAVDALRAAAESYHAAASQKDRDRVVALYDADPLMVPPGADLVEGAEAVGAYRFGFIETPGVELVFDLVRAEVSASGDMGWTLAVGQITIHNDDGTTGRDVVRDFHTWRRQADGSWAVVVDVWNSGPVPEG